MFLLECGSFLTKITRLVFSDIQINSIEIGVNSPSGSQGTDQRDGNVQPSFSSRFAFILSAAGSAIGLANIWKFPYIVGAFGGGGFISIYLLFTLLVGLPAFLSEIFIGKATQKGPEGAFFDITKSKKWKKAGLITVVTGFLVSSFYSVVAGQILGYFFDASFNGLKHVFDVNSAHIHFMNKTESPFWTMGFHGLFMLIAFLFLVGSIKRGIEFCNRIFMPIFFIILLTVVGLSFTLPTASNVISFMTNFDISALPPTAFLVALGHSFFTLSVGQGTLVTYGSYLKPKDKLIKSALCVIGADVFVSLCAAFVMLSVVFNANMEMNFGPALLFETLPAIFSGIPGGQVLLTLFFFLVFIAALTSQISALEPMIAHVIHKSKKSRNVAALLVCLTSFLIGVPSALSANVLKNFTIFGNNFFDIISFTTLSFLIPLGGLLAVILVGKMWGVKNAINSLNEQESKALLGNRAALYYLKFTITYIAPILIVIVFLNSLGII